MLMPRDNHHACICARAGAGGGLIGQSSDTAGGTGATQVAGGVDSSNALNAKLHGSLVRSARSLHWVIPAWLYTQTCLCIHSLPPIYIFDLALSPARLPFLIPFSSCGAGTVAC